MSLHYKLHGYTGTSGLWIGRASFVIVLVPEQMPGSVHNFSANIKETKDNIKHFSIAMQPLVSTVGPMVLLLECIS